MPGENEAHYSVDLTTTQLYYIVISSMTLGHKEKNHKSVTKVEKAD